MAGTIRKIPHIRVAILAGKQSINNTFFFEKLTSYRDNEKPRRKAEVHAFEAQGRPITNEEVSPGASPVPLPSRIELTNIQYAKYLQAIENPRIPASWAEVSPDTSINGHAHGSAKTANGNENGVNGRSHTNGHTENPLSPAFLEGKAVRTVYGMVPLKYALDWPVFASYDELAGCASWLGGRIPTFEEARSLYEHVCRSKKDNAEKILSKTVPAVNGYVSPPPPSTNIMQLL